MISSDLSWNQRISLVLNKISKTTGIVSKVRHLIPCNLTRHLYLALVQPYISYCNIVWSRCQSSTQLDKILKIQKKYCRLITFSNFRAHSYPLFKQLQLLTVYQIYQYQLAMFMYSQMDHLVAGSPSKPIHQSMIILLANMTNYTWSNVELESANLL